MKEIYEEHKGLLYWMLALVVVAVAFLIYGLVTLSPSAAVVKTGYSDIGGYENGTTADALQATGGYEDGSWSKMMVFPIFALILGVLHNFIGVKIYTRRGEGMARVFVAMSVVLVVLAWIVLARLLGEG